MRSQLVDLDSLELRILLAEGEGSPAIHGSATLEMREVRDNVCQDAWFKLQRSGVTSTALGGTSVAALRDLQQRSPRKQQAAAAAASVDGQDLGEIHVRMFAARSSDEAAAEKKLVEPAYAAVVSVLSRPPFRDSIYLCNVAPQTAGDKVAASLVSVLQRAHVVLPFIRAVVDQEVSSTASSSVLFRSNSMAIRVLSAYGRVAGDGYLRAVLGDLVRDVCADTTSYEPDPSVVAPAQAAANTAHIAKLSEKFLGQIMAKESLVSRTAWVVLCARLSRECRSIIDARTFVRVHLCVTRSFLRRFVSFAMMCVALWGRSLATSGHALWAGSSSCASYVPPLRHPQLRGCWTPVLW